MKNIIEIIWLTLQCVGAGFFDIVFFAVLFSAITIYLKFSAIEANFGNTRKKLWKKILNSVSVGVLGSIIGSFLIVFIGICVEQYNPEVASIPTVFIIVFASLFMSIFNDRFIDLVYGASIISIASIFTKELTIFIPGVIALVAVLHIVEAFFIYLDGDTDASPILLRNAAGEIAGGFSFLRAWPMPIIVLLTVAVTALPEEMVQMPNWWPLMKDSSLVLGGISITLFPISTLVYYKDITITKPIKAHINSMAASTLTYGVGLLALSFCAVKFVPLTCVLPIVAIIGHEYLADYRQKKEIKKDPYFMNKKYGLRVLLVGEKTPAEAMGMESGDILTKCNGENMDHEKGLTNILQYRPNLIKIEFEKNNGEIKTGECANLKGISNLGALLVPRGIEGHSATNIDKNKLQSLIDQIKKNKNQDS